MPHCSVVLKDASLLLVHRNVKEICYSSKFGTAWYPSTPRNGVASFNSMEQRDILQHHGAAWHLSTPRRSVASSNTMEQLDILQHYGAAWHPSTPLSSVASFNTTEQRRVVLKDATLLRGVGGCNAALGC
jgi:hypothetical protein